jgi:hypothetical protein
MIELQQSINRVFASNLQPQSVTNQNHKLLITPTQANTMDSIASNKLKVTAAGTYINLNLPAFFSESIKFDVTMNCIGVAKSQTSKEIYDEIVNNLMIAPLLSCCTLTVQHPTSLDRSNSYNDWCVQSCETVDMFRKGDDIHATDGSFNIKCKQNQTFFLNKNIGGRAGYSDDKSYVYRHFNDWSKCICLNWTSMIFSDKSIRH